VVMVDQLTRGGWQVLGTQAVFTPWALGLQHTFITLVGSILDTINQPSTRCLVHQQERWWLKL